MPRILSFALLLLTLLLGGTTPTSAALGPTGDTSASATKGLTLDVELDPIAYALKGHSVHVGLRKGRYRGDIGAFGLELPEAFQGGNEGFDAAFSGVGVKLDRHFKGEGTGFFLGIEGATALFSIGPSEEELRLPTRQGTVGIRGGWRIPLAKGIYISPWIGVGANLGEKAIETSGGTYQVPNIYVFPTIHLGYHPE